MNTAAIKARIAELALHVATSTTWDNTEAMLDEMDRLERELKVAPVTAEDAQIGDPVHWSGWSDTHTGWIVAMTPTRITVEQGEGRLLNGANSGEADALQMTPGGFCAHTEGVQRWEISRTPNAPTLTFTRRKDGRFRRVGNTSGGLLWHGLEMYYDFNF